MSDVCVLGFYIEITQSAVWICKMCMVYETRWTTGRFSDARVADDTLSFTRRCH
jgi:hypothetical protein